jgi:hypothetical protein
MRPVSVYPVLFTFFPLLPPLARRRNVPASAL